jgi:hypothetical protein
MVLVEVDSVVVHATSVTATTRVLSVLANATMAVAHVTTQLPGLLLLCGLKKTETKIFYKFYLN